MKYAKKIDSFNTLTHKNEAGLIFFTETPLANYIFSRGALVKNSKNTDLDLMKLSKRGFFNSSGFKFWFPINAHPQVSSHVMVV